MHFSMWSQSRIRCKCSIGPKRDKDSLTSHTKSAHQVTAHSMLVRTLCMNLGMGTCCLCIRTECRITSTRRISPNVLLMRLRMGSSNRMAQSLIVSLGKPITLASLIITFHHSRKVPRSLGYAMRVASMTTLQSRLRRFFRRAAATKKKRIQRKTLPV